MVEYQEHPHRITEKDPNTKWVAPTAVVPNIEFEIFEFTAPPMMSYVFEEGHQIFADLRTTATGNPHLPDDVVVKLIKFCPDKTEKAEVMIAPYAQWRELVDALRKLYQTETWKLPQLFKLVISYIPTSTAHVLSAPHCRMLLECIKVSPKLE